MRARAETTAATRERILDAGEEIFDELLIDGFTLAAVAQRADVSVQTVLRHFDSRDGALVATLLHAGQKMRSNREVPTEDANAAIGVLVDHYDRFGDRILRLLAESERHPTLRAMTEFGRVYHREWCEQIFEAPLKGVRGAKRERRIAQFVAVTDIYVWKLLRRDRGLSARQTKLAMCELLEPLRGGGR